MEADIEQQDLGSNYADTPYQNPMDAYGSSIVQLTDPSVEIERLELFYKGHRINDQGKIEKIGKPLMNEDGVSRIVGTVGGIVSQSTILGNLDTNSEIKPLILGLSDTLILDLLENGVTNYKIQDKTSRDVILYTSQAKAFIVMRRASERGLSDKKFWRGSQQDIRTTVVNDGKKGNFLDKVMGWGR